MERQQRYWTMALFLVLGTFLLAGTALAVDPAAPTALDRGPSGSRNLSSLPTQTINALAGNVTQVNISALAITQGWQGYYGNVSGTIILADADNNTFYNWTQTTTSGELFATRAASPTWSGTNCSNASLIATEETALGMSASDADSVSNTFSGANTHPTFDVAGYTVPANDCPATNTWDNSGQATNKFYQVLLADGGNNVVYTTLLNDSVTAFDGQSWDFELLVGEDGHANSAVTAYYFWVELN